MESAFQAIAEPHRRRILEILWESDELSSGEIASHFHQTPASVSQHLGVLEHAGLVSMRREGTRRLYRLRDDGFRELHAFLERFWTSGLRRLKTSAGAKTTVPARSRGKTGRTPSDGTRLGRRRSRA